MSPTSPKHARKTVRRSAVAVTAVAAAAAMTVSTPAAANAATTPTGNPQIDALLAAAPLLPGGIPIAVIPQIAPQINQGVAAWNQVPVLSSLFPVSNTTAGSPLGVTPLAPGWVGAWASDTFKVGAPLGLGGLTTTTYGVAGLSLIPGQLGVGSIGGNNTTLSGPLGSTLGLSTSLSAITGANGLTTWTPSLGLNATAPLNLGNATATIVPVTVTYGDKTFLVGLPSINLGFGIPLLGIEGNLALNLGTIGFQNGNLVLVTPSLGGELTTPLGGGEFETTPGKVSLGTGGLNVVAPGANGEFNVLGDTVTGDFKVLGGGASLTPTGASVTGPSLEGELSTPLGGVEIEEASTGSASVGAGGINVTGPEAEVEVNTPVGSADLDIEGGNANVTPGGNVEVNGPSGDLDVDTPAGDVEVGVDTGSVNAGPTTGVDVEGPSGEVSVTPTGGDTTTVSGSTGGGSVDTDGDVDIDPPSVDVSTTEN